MKVLAISLLLIGFIFFILFVVVSTILRSSLNRKRLKEFMNRNKADFIGDFECTTKRNFFSFANNNYSFSFVSLYKLENGILLYPSVKYLGFRSYCKPFIISNKPINLLNLEVCKAEVKHTNDPNRLILIQAELNTKLELTLFDCDVPITEKIE